MLLQPISQITVENLYRPEPRTFRWGNDEEVWYEDIAADLAEGHNVAVCSMATEAIDRIEQRVLSAGLLEKAKILVFVKNTSDVLRDKLVNVNKLFSAYRLVLYSPTIEAGVGKPCLLALEVTNSHESMHAANQRLDVALVAMQTSRWGNQAHTLYMHTCDGFPCCTEPRRLIDIYRRKC